MQKLADRLIQEGYFPGLPSDLVYAAFMVLAAFVVLSVFVAPLAGITSWLERRVWGRIQSRVGPNRVGPQGILQWLADGIKNLLKEDIIPAAADKWLFSLAPYIVFVGFLATFVVIPFGGDLIVADLNIGILYILAVTSLVVVGILMAGWSSNNKWSLLGGMRSAAQIVSYEIPAGLSVLTIVFVAGTMSMQGIIKGQGWEPWNWFLFNNPFTFAAFFLFFTAALAEGNRTPFDVPEAESELVAGYVTEYSGMRFLFFFFAEWGNLYVIGAVATTLFFGWLAGPCNNGKSDPPGHSPVYRFFPEGLSMGSCRHVGKRDSPSGQSRSVNVSLLEVHGSSLLYLPVGDCDMDGHLAAGNPSREHSHLCFGPGDLGPLCEAGKLPDSPCPSGALLQTLHLINYREPYERTNRIH